MFNYIIRTATDPIDNLFEADFLPMFDIEAFPGVMELSRNQIDPFSDPIVIDGGLVLGNEVVTTALVYIRRLYLLYTGSAH